MKQRRRFSFRSGLLIVALAAVVPMWQVWYIGPTEGVGSQGFLWHAVEMVPNNAEHVGVFRAIFINQWTNILLAVGLFVLGSAFGRGLLDEIAAQRARRRQARGQCVQCGYDLRGSATGKCPECGAGRD